MAAEFSATDSPSGRHHQRFAFGALALELNGQNELVSREVVQTTNYLVFNATMKACLGRRGEDGDDL